MGDEFLLLGKSSMPSFAPSSQRADVDKRRWELALPVGHILQEFRKSFDGMLDCDALSTWHFLLRRRTEAFQSRCMAASWL